MCLLLAAGSIGVIRGEGFLNGPVTFGTGDQAHPGGAKSFATFTLGGTAGNAVNTQSIPKVTTVSTGGTSISVASL